MQTIIVPLDVPEEKHETYRKNYSLATRDSGNLMLFAGDQKIEHLNDDFYGDGIDEENDDPEHLFKIASHAKIGVFATQLGLIARYGMDYSDISYVIKVNSKTNLVKTKDAEPLSVSLLSPDELFEFISENKLTVVGIGYTIYLGSEHEEEMLKEASEFILKAHQHGLISILWMYPRGKAVPNEKDPHIIAGAAGVAAALGADFVKINPPEEVGKSSAELLKEAVRAAGRTKVICAGGKNTDPQLFLQTLYDQIHIGGTNGSATGRNIHEKPLDEAISFCNAIYAITVEGNTVEKALEIYKDPESSSG